MTSHQIFENKENHELYTQFIHLNNQDPKINRLVDDNNGNLIYPENVEIKSIISPPVDHIYDIGLLSFTFSNAFHRIREGVNDVLRLYFYSQTIENVGNAVIYVLKIKVREGNYTDQTLELELNSQFHKLNTVNAYVPDLVRNPEGNPVPFSVPTNDPNFNPFKLSGHTDTKYSGHSSTSFVLPQFMSMFYFYDGIPLTNEGEPMGTEEEIFPPPVGRRNELANILGYKSVGYGGWFAENVNPVPTLRVLYSNTYNNIEFSNTELHFTSNVIASIAEKPPSINSINKDNIFYTYNCSEGVASQINHFNPYPEITRIKCKPFSKLSEIDIALNDSNFEKIDNTQNDLLNLVLVVRTLKTLR